MFEDLATIQERHPRAAVVNSPRAGTIAADKAATNEALSAVVAMPSNQTGAAAGRPLFVNEVIGTQQKTMSLPFFLASR